MDNSTEATDVAIDFIRLALGMFVGMMAGIVLAFIITVIVRAISHKHEILKLTITKVRVSVYVFTAFLGGAVGFEYATEHLRATSPPRWVGTAEHVLLILLILAATWMGMRLVSVIEDIAYHFSHDSKGGRGMRVATQAQILRRIGQALVIICGVAGIVLTFPQARLVTGSILASAGVVSIVAGMAAQSSLSNMFAGLQIAISDSLRVGDIVVVDNNGVPTQATVEEITLTYIVVRIWDDRRIIIPSLKFTQNSFENWTRRAASLMGTVEIDLDWNVSINVFRQQVDKLLSSTDLWDGRSFSVQVTKTVENKMTVTVYISARNAGDLWDLRCYLREHLIDWVRTEQPQAIPRMNLLVNDAQKLMESLEELNLHALPENSGESKEQPEKFLVDTEEKTLRKNATDTVFEEVADSLVAEDVQKIVDDTTGETTQDSKETKLTKKQKRAKKKQEKLTGQQKLSVPVESVTLPNEDKVSSDISSLETDLQSVNVKDETDQAQVKRVSINDKNRQDNAEKTRIADLEETQVLTASQIRDQFVTVSEINAYVEQAQEDSIHDTSEYDDEQVASTETSLANERLYSGSPENEERGKIFDGPGAEVIEEREKTALLHTRDFDDIDEDSEEVEKLQDEIYENINDLIIESNHELKREEIK